jgi:hypothetical protein
MVYAGVSFEPMAIAREKSHGLSWRRSAGGIRAGENAPILGESDAAAFADFQP